LVKLWVGEAHLRGEETLSSLSFFIHLFPLFLCRPHGPLVALGVFAAYKAGVLLKQQQKNVRWHGKQFGNRNAFLMNRKFNEQHLLKHVSNIHLL